jgi:cytochrome c2
MRKAWRSAAGRKWVFALAALAFSSPEVRAGDLAAGKAVFLRACHGCHAALPYNGRIGVANLPPFLANPKRYKPTTAMNFKGLKSKKDIDDVIVFITAAH